MSWAVFFGFSMLGFSTRSDGQQTYVNTTETSSSTGIDPSTASEAGTPGQSSSGKVKSRNVSEFNLSLGAAAQLTATRTANQQQNQSIAGTTPSANFVATFNQQIRPLVGYGINFGYTRLTENYERNFGVFNPASGVATGSYSRGSIPVNMFEISSAYVVKRHQLGSKFQPFAEAGGGVLIFSPTDAPFAGHSSFRATFLFGGGVDYRINSNFGLRAEYRGLLYKYPDFAAVTSAVPVSKYFTVTSEPTISIRYHFGHHGGIQ